MTQEEILQTGRLAGDVLDLVLARQAQHCRHLLRRHLKAQAVTVLDDVEPQGRQRLPDGAELDTMKKEKLRLKDEIYAAVLKYKETL